MDLLPAIKSYWVVNRCPPTLRELQKLCGMSSVSVVWTQLKELEQDGSIEKRVPYKRRAIIPTDLIVRFP